MNTELTRLLSLSGRELAQEIPDEAKLNEVNYELASDGEANFDLDKLEEAVRTAWREHI